MSRGNSEMMNFIVSENKKILDALTTSMQGIDTKLDKINVDFMQMKTDVNNIAGKVDKHVDFTKKKFEEYDNKMHHLSTQNNKLKLYIDNLERIRRLSDILIDGVPMLPATTDTRLVVESLCNYLGTKITGSDIIKCYRISNKAKDNATIVKPATILVKFASEVVRKNIIDNYFTNKATLKLSDFCTNLNIDTRVYLSDNLTNSMQSVSRKCYTLKKEGKIKKYYSRKGFIYITSTKISCIKDFYEFVDTLNLSNGSTSTTI